MKISGIGERKKLIFLILLGAVGILLVFWGFLGQNGGENTEIEEKSEEEIKEE